MLHTAESLILLASAATAGVALALVAYALRGRRTDDHPICRKCGFDLFGLPATSTNCPECGNNLTHRRATRIGHRRKRRALLARGLLGTLLAFGTFGTITIARVRGVNWYHYAPVSWLIRENAYPDTRDAAMREVMSRLAAGTLTDSAVRELARAALANVVLKPSA